MSIKPTKAHGIRDERAGLEAGEPEAPGLCESPQGRETEEAQIGQAQRADRRRGGLKGAGVIAGPASLEHGTAEGAVWSNTTCPDAVTRLLESLADEERNAAAEAGVKAKAS